MNVDVCIQPLKIIKQKKARVEPFMVHYSVNSLKENGYCITVATVCTHLRSNFPYCRRFSFSHLCSLVAPILKIILLESSKTDKFPFPNDDIVLDMYKNLLVSENSVPRKRRDFNYHVALDYRKSLKKNKPARIKSKIISKQTDKEPVTDFSNLNSEAFEPAEASHQPNLDINSEILNSPNLFIDAVHAKLKVSDSIDTQHVKFDSINTKDTESKVLDSTNIQDTESKVSDSTNIQYTESKVLDSTNTQDTESKVSDSTNIQYTESKVLDSTNTQDTESKVSDSTNIQYTESKVLDSTNTQDTESKVLDSTNIQYTESKVLDSTNTQDTESKVSDSTNIQYTESKVFDSTNTQVRESKVSNSVKEQIPVLKVSDSNFTQNTESKASDSNKGQNPDSKVLDSNYTQNTESKASDSNKEQNPDSKVFDSNYTQNTESKVSGSISKQYGESEVFHSINKKSPDLKSSYSVDRQDPESQAFDSINKISPERSLDLRPVETTIYNNTYYDSDDNVINFDDDDSMDDSSSSSNVDCVITEIPKNYKLPPEVSSVNLMKLTTNNLHFEVIKSTKLPDFEDLLCFKKHIELLNKHVIEPLCIHSISHKGRGVLITGESGCGKTTLALALVKRISNTISAHLINQTNASLQDFFNYAIEHKIPAIIIENLDSICTPSWDKTASSKYVNCISKYMDLLRNADIITIATATNKSKIPSDLLTSGRFDNHRELENPTFEERMTLLKAFALPIYINDLLLRLASNTLNNTTIRDLKILMRDAKIHAKLNNLNFISQESLDFAFSMKPTKHINKHSVDIPSVKWSDIGGLNYVKKIFDNSVLNVIKYPKLYSACGLKNPSSILLYGPPGCGKTLIAQAVANSCKINFMSVKGPEIYNKWLGESEANIRKIFEDASNASPCLIFFDEFDSICSKREFNDSSTKSDVVNQLLTELDGVFKRKGVIVIAATNRIDAIDPAVLRPGRFDIKIYIPPPNTKMRYKIFKALKRIFPLCDSVDLKLYATKTKNFTGADIAGLLNTAALELALEQLALRKSLKDEVPKDLKITDQILRKVISSCKPSVSYRDLLQYNSTANI